MINRRPADLLRPSLRFARVAALLSGATLLVAATLAGTPAQAAPPVGIDPSARDVRTWLMRIHEAASHRNFQGTLVMTAGGTATSARMAHYCVGAHEYERSVALDGKAREVYRHNDVVVTAWPSSHVATVEKRDSIAQFPALLQAGDDRLVDRYELRPQGVERLAGRDADVLIVQPLDAMRYGYRLWADHASGLLLRVDTLDERHAVLESSAFSDVAIDIKPKPESVLQPMTRLEGYRIEHPPMVPTRLEAEGWTVHDLASGFRQVSCVRRPAMAAPDDDAKAPTEAQVVQTIYSDGLTYVSVFIEPYDRRRPRTPMSTAMGATQTLMEQKGDWWVTLVGDVPPETLRHFAQGLDRRK